MFSNTDTLLATSHPPDREGTVLVVPAPHTAQPEAYGKTSRVKPLQPSTPNPPVRFDKVDKQRRESLSEQASAAVWTQNGRLWSSEHPFVICAGLNGSQENSVRLFSATLKWARDARVANDWGSVPDSPLLLK